MYKNPLLKLALKVSYTWYKVVREQREKKKRKKKSNTKTNYRKHIYAERKRGQNITLLIFHRFEVLKRKHVYWEKRTKDLNYKLIYQTDLPHVVWFVHYRLALTKEKKKEKEMLTLNLKKGCPNLVLEGYALGLWKSHSLSLLAKLRPENIVCVHLKKKSHTHLERHEGNKMMREFSFLAGVSH